MNISFHNAIEQVFTLYAIAHPANFQIAVVAHRSNLTFSKTLIYKLVNTFLILVSERNRNDQIWHHLENVKPQSQFYTTP